MANDLDSVLVRLDHTYVKFERQGHKSNVGLFKVMVTDGLKSESEVGKNLKAP